MLFRSFSGNYRLSEGRAKALINYLITQFDYPRSIYKEIFGGENWLGLKEIIEQSNMQYKQQVKEILSSVSASVGDNNTTLKRPLMDIDNGEAWAYMLKEYFPALRKAVCIIDFDVKRFNLIEAREVAKYRSEERRVGKEC